MNEITIFSIAFGGLALGILIGYYLPSRKRRPQDLLLETETLELDALSDIKQQLHNLNYFATQGEFALGVHHDAVTSLDGKHVCDIESHINDIVKQHQAIFESKGITFKSDFAKDLPYGAISKKDFNHVFMSILLNSTHALSQGGEIKICVHVKSDVLHIDVEDNGIGIPSNIISKIFDPFFTTKYHGTGLGLFSAKDLLRKYKGHISVKSVKDGGTCVKMIIPASKKSTSSDG